DPEAEFERVRAEVAAGAHFLITRPLYELDSLRRMAAALAGTGLPVLASIAPLRTFEDADYLAHEVPEVNMPAAALHAMERARATMVHVGPCGMCRSGRPGRTACCSAPAGTGHLLASPPCL